MRARFVKLWGITVLASAQQPSLQPLTVNADAVLSHIKGTIGWYRHVTSVEQTPALAADVLLRENTHASALKAVQLALEFGRAVAPIADASNSKAAPAANGPGRNLPQATARAAARVENLQSQIAALDKSIAAARSASRDILRAQRETAQAELVLATQVRDMVGALAAYNPGGGSGSLAAQVEELARSVPEVAPQARAATRPGAAPAPAPAADDAAAAASPRAAPFRPESTGILGLATEIFTLSRNRGQIRNAIDSTDQLLTTLDQVRAPLLNEMRGLVRRSEDLATITGDESVEQLASDRHNIELLQVRFKQLSPLLLPLGEQRIVLGSARASLAQALEGVSAQYSEAGRYLLLRLGMLALAVGVVVALSGIWRRVTFRYVHDARRRTQFLMLRRVLVAFAITVVVVLSFVSEFGSLATYAGLLTAGIAVALQNVILSVVAYFFLIGRYGIRTGDRVTISGVTGNVIDIGLVRIYLVELTGTSGEWHPTGRVVVYSNSVIFQPSALFKQMPETDYVWHTIRLVLTAESDFHRAETRITEAVEAVYQHYREGIDRQHANFERAVDAQMTQPRPEVRLQYSIDGLEALVYYPAGIKTAALTDREIVNALEHAIAGDPELTLAAAGNPQVVARAA